MDTDDATWPTNHRCNRKSQPVSRHYGPPYAMICGAGMKYTQHESRCDYASCATKWRYGHSQLRKKCRKSKLRVKGDEAETVDSIQYAYETAGMSSYPYPFSDPRACMQTRNAQCKRNQTSLKSHGRLRAHHRCPSHYRPTSSSSAPASSCSDYAVPSPAQPTSTSPLASRFHPPTRALSGAPSSSHSY